MPRFFLQSPAVGLTLLAAIAAWAPGPCAHAHESDQFTLPAGRKFADLGDYLNRWAFDTIQRGVRNTNARIRRAIENGASESRIEMLQSPETVTVAVTRAFPVAFRVIEDLNWMTHSRAVQRRYPGAVVGYKDQFDNVYKNVHFPLDPRQIFRIWHSATIKVYDTYVGTDKIGHFTDMGRHYYHAYVKAKQNGASEDQAIQAAVKVGNEGLIFSESGALGYLSAGAYSNGDMAANYLGLQFYRNLTMPVVLKGEKRSPMLERAGAYWRIAEPVAPDSDFFRRFVSEHLNEALNPSHFEKGMRDAIRDAVHNRRAMVLWRYRDVHGQFRPPQWFEQKARQLSTYYGQDYGHRGTAEELITIADACFPRFSKDAAVHQRNDAGYTPLHDAVLHNDAVRLRTLLEKGAKADIPIASEHPSNTEDGSTALHLAARDGRGSHIKLLIKHGADVNATNALDQTPLHKAVGHREVMVQLIEAGGSISARDAQGRTPLHWAAREPGGDTAALLINRGAEVDATDKHGHTPLHRAAMAGQDAAAQALLEADASPQAKANLGITPMHLAAAHNHPELVYRLSQYGAAVDNQDATGWRPLHAAAHHGERAAVQALFQAGADANSEDMYGTTPLHLACRAKQRATALMLIENGADVTHANRREVTALHEAAFAGETALTKALLEAGAKPRRANARGQTPSALARQQAHRHVAELIAQEGQGDASSNP